MRPDGAAAAASTCEAAASGVQPTLLSTVRSTPMLVDTLEALQVDINRLGYSLTELKDYLCRGAETTDNLDRQCREIRHESKRQFTEVQEVTTLVNTSNTSMSSARRTSESKDTELRCQHVSENSSPAKTNIHSGSKGMVLSVADRLAPDPENGGNNPGLQCKPTMEKMKKVGSAPELVAPRGSVKKQNRFLMRAKTVQAANSMGLKNLGESTRAVFPDAEAMKDKFRAAILLPEEKAGTYYYDSGVCQAVAQSPYFEMATFTMIILNSLWLAVEVSLNDKELVYDSAIGFQIVEHFFCFYFFVEWCIRFGGMRCKSLALRDRWLIFDFCLVVNMVIETWLLTIILLLDPSLANGSIFNGTSVLRVVKLFRLTRVARIGRLLRGFPEILLIGKSLAIVFRTVMLILSLLVIVVYIFSIMMTQIAKGTPLEEQFFEHVPHAMYMLTLGAIIPDQSVMMVDLGTEGWFFAALFLLFVILATTLLMNLLVGVLVEVVGAVAGAEREKNQISAVKEELETILRNIDCDNDGSIDKAEFEQILRNVDTAKRLHSVGVDPVSLVESADSVFAHKNTLEFKEFLELLLELRGGNETKVRDLMYLRRYIILELKRLEMKLDRNIPTVDTRSPWDAPKLDGKAVPIEGQVGGGIAPVKRKPSKASSGGDSWNVQVMGHPHRHEVVGNGFKEPFKHAFSTNGVTDTLMAKTTTPSKMASVDDLLLSAGIDDMAENYCDDSHADDDKVSVEGTSAPKSVPRHLREMHNKRKTRRSKGGVSTIWGDLSEN